jgi:hypothetical protein
MIESTKGLWSESMDGDGIAPVRDEFRMGGLEGDMQQQEQHGNNVLAAQQAKEAQDELESWLQVRERLVILSSSGVLLVV